MGKRQEHYHCATLPPKSSIFLLGTLIILATHRKAINEELVTCFGSESCEFESLFVLLPQQKSSKSGIIHTVSRVAAPCCKSKWKKITSFFSLLGRAPWFTVSIAVWLQVKTKKKRNT